MGALRDDADHVGATSPRPAAARASTSDRKVGFETRPAGNAVSLEDEMMKVAANQMDYAAVTSLYTQEPASSEDRDRQGLSWSERRWQTINVMDFPARWGSRRRACARRPGACG